MDIRKIIREEMDGLDWLINTNPTKWDYFEDLIKDIPVINIKKNSGGEWVNFNDDIGSPYFGWDFYEDYGLNPNIRSNPLIDILNAVSESVETLFNPRYDGDTKDYKDFIKLMVTLEKANKQDLPDN